MADFTRSAVVLALLAVCMVYIWSEIEASPVHKATGKAGFRTDLEEVIATAKQANDFLDINAKRGLRSKLGKYLFGRRRHRHHGGGEEEEGYGRYGGDYYGGRYGDRYGDPYDRFGDPYGDRFGGGRYGSRYRSRYNYEEYEE